MGHMICAYASRLYADMRCPQLEFNQFTYGDDRRSYAVSISEL